MWTKAGSQEEPAREKLGETTRLSFSEGWGQGAIISALKSHIKFGFSPGSSVLSTKHFLNHQLNFISERLCLYLHIVNPEYLGLALAHIRHVIVY